MRSIICGTISLRLCIRTQMTHHKYVEFFSTTTTLMKFIIMGASLVLITCAPTSICILRVENEEVGGVMYFQKTMSLWKTQAPQLLSHRLFIATDLAMIHYQMIPIMTTNI